MDSEGILATKAHIFKEHQKIVRINSISIIISTMSHLHFFINCPKIIHTYEAFLLSYLDP